MYFPIQYGLYLCRLFFCEEWALKEGNLHRMLAAKVLTHYRRAKKARQQLAQHKEMFSFTRVLCKADRQSHGKAQTIDFRSLRGLHLLCFFR